MSQAGGNSDEEAKAKKDLQKCSSANCRHVVHRDLRAVYDHARTPLLGRTPLWGSRRWRLCSGLPGAGPCQTPSRAGPVPALGYHAISLARAARAQSRVSVNESIQPCILTMCPSSKSWRVRHHSRSRRLSASASGVPFGSSTWPKSIKPKRICAFASCGTIRRYCRPIRLALSSCLSRVPSLESRELYRRRSESTAHVKPGVSAKSKAQRRLAKNRRRLCLVSIIAASPECDPPA
jgi:hypothetical protein